MAFSSSSWLTPLFLLILLTISITPTLPTSLLFQPHPSLRSPPPCCFPTCTTRANLLFGSVGSASSSQVSAYFDEDRYKAAILGVGTGGDPAANISVVVDYAKGVLYIVTPKGRQCKTVEIPAGLSGTCIPDYAEYQYLGRSRVGWAEEKISVDRFFVDGNQGGVDLEFEVGVTPDACGPVSLSLWGQARDEQVVSQMSFYDVAEGIGDPAVFEVPDYCGLARERGTAARLEPIVEALGQVFTFMHRKRKND